MSDRFEVISHGCAIGAGGDVVVPKTTAWLVIETESNGCAGTFASEDHQAACALCEQLNRDWEEGRIRYVALETIAAGTDDEGGPRDIRHTHWRVCDLKSTSRTPDVFSSHAEAYAEASRLNRVE